MFLYSNNVVEVYKVNESFEGVSHKYRDGLFSAISVGFFFVLVGAIFVTTPNLFDKILDFFRDFDLVTVPNQPRWLLPAPASPMDHSVVYSAVVQFSFALGLFQIVVLALRFVARSPWSKKAETVSNLVFWLGASFLTRTFLIETTRWFVFWAGIIMLIGVSLITRAIILVAYAGLTQKR
jgi:hypothetical protein